ncbi:MAG TPA: hypothetical protein ENI68_07385 [Gammaproteobacteria bacterium]|nr:hypothetical protein [Gammaproteobacteria bacterium]
MPKYLKEPYLDTGVQLANQGRYLEAEIYLLQSIVENPSDITAYWNLALLHEKLDNHVYSQQLWKRLISLTEDDAPIRKLASSYYRADYRDEDFRSALYWFQKIKKPSPIDINNLIVLHNGTGHTNAVRSLAEQHNYFTSKMVMPFVYDSSEEIECYRQTYESCLDELLKSGEKMAFKELRQQYCLPFTLRLSYHNCNNRDLFRKQYQTFTNICPELSYQSNFSQRARSGRLRVGFISEYFMDHSVARDRGGIIAHISRDKFEVITIFLQKPRDTLGRYIWNHSDRHLMLTEKSNYDYLDVWRNQIEELELDVLIYCDIGMSVDTYFLAYSRLAPVQITTWGHSDTSGIGTIDYFISSELFEDPERCHDHYTEELILTKSICTYYINHSVNITHNKLANNIGEKYWLDNEYCHIYLSLQTKQKFHPDFDYVYQGILAGDPCAVIVMCAVTSQVKAEFYKRIRKKLRGNIRRLILLEKQLSLNEYLALLKYAHVILDSYPFGGCNSCFEAFYFGKCIITRPSHFINGRFTSGMYMKMGVTDLIAHSNDEYIQLALRVASDDTYREALEQRIREQSGQLFEDKESVREWEDILERVASRLPSLR